MTAAARQGPPQPITADSVADALALFVRDPNHVVELRALRVIQRFGRPQTVAGFFDSSHLIEMAKEALRLTETASGCYFTLSPLRTDILARCNNRVQVADSGSLASDQHVVRRRWLYIDIDPVRLSGISATDAEKAEAHKVADAVRRHLDALGWPPPIVCDSGNGFHLFWAVDLPPNDGGLVQQCLAALAKRFDTNAATVDTSVYNAARIAKIPKTWARKGDPTPDRPHRRAGILEVPSDVRRVPTKLLEGLAAEIAPHLENAAHGAAGAPLSHNGHTRRNARRIHRLNVPRWLEARSIAFRTKDAPDAKGRTVYTLDRCPFNPDHTAQDAAILQGDDGKLAFHCFHQSCAGRGWQAAKQAIGPPDPEHYDPPLRRLAQEGETKPNECSDVADNDNRPAIQIGPGHDQECVEAALKLLCAQQHTYLRGGTFVHLDRPKPPKRKARAIVDRRGETPPTVTVTTTDLIGTKLDSLARWFRVKKGKGDAFYAVGAHLPDRLLKAIANWPCKYTYGGRILEAVTTAPTMRTDGEIIQTRGYDSDSGILFVPTRDYPAVPSHPTRDDAIHASELIFDVVCDFPFRQAFHRSAWLALMLTLAARMAITGDRPLFALTANQPGTGKDLLANTAHIAVFGRELPVMGWPDREEERDKRMLVVAMNDDPCILLGNIVEPLGGETLEKALTSSTFKGRLLGVSKDAEAPLNTVFIATGNNLVYTSDGMQRRVIPIALYYEKADPELRHGFKYKDLKAHVRQCHKELVVAALTILRAFHVAGRPESGEPAIGGFEQWSELIRNAVLWLDLPDPAAGRAEVKRQRDSSTDAFVTLLRSLAARPFGLPGKDYFSVAYLRKWVEDNTKTGDGVRPDPDAELVRDALAAMVRGSKAYLPNGHAIGGAFRKMAGRVFDGLRLDEMPESIREHGAACWCVVKADADGGSDFGDSGDLFPATPRSESYTDNSL
jgi:hypothetical protein